MSNSYRKNYLSKIIAHRGASALAPENTLAAFRKAAEMGARWVEFDVMLAASGEVVVIHDEMLERTTNGIGLVSECSYSYLQTLDAGSWFNAAFAGEKIPTLVQVLELLCDLDLMANVEIKPASGCEDETVQQVLKVIDENWPADKKPLLVSSFSEKVLECVRKYSSTQPLGFLMDEWQDEWQKKCDALDCISVHLNKKIVTHSRVEAIHATNRLLLSYTVDDPLLAKQFFAWNVDAVFSNALNCDASIL